MRVTAYTGGPNSNAISKRYRNIATHDHHQVDTGHLSPPAQVSACEPTTAAHTLQLAYYIGTYATASEKKPLQPPQGQVHVTVSLRAIALSIKL